MRRSLGGQQRCSGKVVDHHARNGPEGRSTDPSELRDQRGRTMPTSGQRTEGDGEHEQSDEDMSIEHGTDTPQRDGDQSDDEYR